MNELFIGGGGYSGIMFIGALEYINENKLLDLKNFYGCSIGSIIGILYISGLTPKHILGKFLELDFNDIIKYDINYDGQCLLDGKLLDSFMDFIWEKYDKEITLSEFSKSTSVNINIFVTNVTVNKYVNFNNKEYPNIKLKDAIKASMSIPFLFSPVEINNEFYIDGGCKNIYGCPPDNKYILGYSIIVETDRKELSYITSILKSLINCDKPNSVFTIICKNIANPGIYMNLNNLNSQFIFDMYKNGIKHARETLT
jgi:predicted patatin/cPLA2 family phospholipase